MPTKEPYIWLQEEEPEGTASCGCNLQNGERGPCLWLCPMHDAAPKLVAAIKHLDKKFGHKFNNADDEIVGEALMAAKGAK